MELSDVLFLMGIVYSSVCTASILKFKIKGTCTWKSFEISLISPILLFCLLLKCGRFLWNEDKKIREKIGRFTYSKFFIDFSLGVIPIAHSKLITELDKILKKDNESIRVLIHSENSSSFKNFYSEASRNLKYRLGTT